MANIHDKVAATGFTSPTALNFEQVLAAADDAAHRSAGVMTKVRKEGIDAENQIIHYAVRRGGMMTVGGFSVHFACPDGQAEVSFEPGDYLTAQPTMLLIPIGPKSSSSLSSFQTFSRIFKAAVSS